MFLDLKIEILLIFLLVLKETATFLHLLLCDTFEHYLSYGTLSASIKNALPKTKIYLHARLVAVASLNAQFSGRSNRNSTASISPSSRLDRSVLLVVASSRYLPNSARNGIRICEN